MLSQIASTRRIRSSTLSATISAKVVARFMLPPCATVHRTWALGTHAWRYHTISHQPVTWELHTRLCYTGGHKSLVGLTPGGHRICPPRRRTRRAPGSLPAPPRPGYSKAPYLSQV